MSGKGSGFDPVAEVRHANRDGIRGIWTASRGSIAVHHWRESMDRTRARASTQRLAVIAGVIGLLASACGSAAPNATSRSATPSNPPIAGSASSAPVATAIPIGRYVGATQQVADIVRRLQMDTSLSESERAAILDDVLEIRGATTYQTTIDVRDGSHFAITPHIDGKADQVEDWTFRSIDDRRFVVDTQCCGTQVYEVAREAQSFRLTAKSPASSNVERFVRSVVFETGAFARAD
jgi:hypothetical protein